MIRFIREEWERVKAWPCPIEWAYWTAVFIGLMVFPALLGWLAEHGVPPFRWLVNALDESEWFQKWLRKHLDRIG